MNFLISCLSKLDETKLVARAQMVACLSDVIFFLFHNIVVKIELFNSFVTITITLLLAYEIGETNVCMVIVKLDNNNNDYNQSKFYFCFQMKLSDCEQLYTIERKNGANLICHDYPSRC